MLRAELGMSRIHWSSRLLLCQIAQGGLAGILECTNLYNVLPPLADVPVTEFEPIPYAKRLRFVSCFIVIAHTRVLHNNPHHQSLGSCFPLRLERAVIAQWEWCAATSVSTSECAHGCFEPCMQSSVMCCMRNSECPIERELRIFPSCARRS